jgi:SAM-dependent methyltransferase
MPPHDDAAAPAGTAIHYVGGELQLFADASVWRAYWQAQVGGFLGARILEVGAGMGTIVRSLARHRAERWLALEPDPAMAGRLRALREAGDLPAFCEPRLGTTADLSPAERFDTALYIDVLEHIEDDRGELARVVRHLEPGGALIVLAPAHQWLFSPFDAAIGHHRRYTRAGLLALAPPGVTLARARYLDSVGLAASLGNRLALRQSAPTLAQIRLWDRAMVRLSRWADPVVGYHLGKSVLVVWRKSREAAA